MASPLEDGSHILVPLPDLRSLDTVKKTDPLSFIESLQIRRIIGYEWEDRVHSILYGIGLLLEKDFHTGKPAERLTFLEIPETHDNSDAPYIYQGNLGKDWVGVYYLPPNSTTSEHSHPSQVTEDYFILKGEMTLQIVGGSAQTVDVDKFTVRPGQRHHSRTDDDQFALVLVRMIGAAEIPESERHYGSSRPFIDLTKFSPRQEHKAMLLSLYHRAYGWIEDPSKSPFAHWIDNMSDAAIRGAIYTASDNPSVLLQSGKFRLSPIANTILPLDEAQ